jgi:hypothetical protein
MDSELSHRFYRQLFLRRYALLLEKAEHTFRLPADVVCRLRSHILSLDWVDGGIELLEQKLRQQTAAN